MKFLLLLLTAIVCLNQNTAAQVLNLLNLNKAADHSRTNNQLLPIIPATDYASRVESNYNLTLMPAALRLDTTNRYHAELMAINSFASVNRKLKGAYSSVLSNMRKVAAANKRTADSLRQVIVDKDRSQLDKLRTTYNRDKPTYKQTVETITKETTRLEGFFNDYWKTPPVVNGTALTFASDSAARALQFTHLPRLVALNEELQNRYVQFDKLGIPLQQLRDTLALNVAYERRYEQLLGTTQKANDSLQATLRRINTAKQQYNTAQAAWDARLKARNERGQTDNATVLPGIASVTGTRLVVPQITGLGSRRAELAGGSGVVQLKLFTALGGGSSTDTNRDSKDRGAEGVFVREISTFGFSGDVAYAFAPSKGPNKEQDKLAIIFSGAYLEKRMTPDSLHTFTTGTLATRLGIEYSPVPRVLSIYAHLNTISFLSNSAQLEQYYTLARPKDYYGFVTTGIKAQLTLDKENATAIDFELGFILKGDNVRVFVPNNDLAITVIKATLVKSFSIK